MKRFFSFPDTKLIGVLPQSMQHELISAKAVALGGEVVGYTTENARSHASYGNLRQKIGTLSQIDGFIFFRCQQFFREGKISVSPLYSILEKGLEVHFVVENWSVRSRKGFDSLLPVLFAGSYTEKRDQDTSFLLELAEHVSE
jgi:hypothetical protein